MLNKSERNGILFFVKLLSLRDFIEQNIEINPIFTRQIKNYTKLLSKELEKQMDVLFGGTQRLKMTESEREELDKERESLLDQYVSASDMSDLFFDYGVRMSNLPEEQIALITKEVEDVFTKYGLNGNDSKKESNLST